MSEEWVKTAKSGDRVVCVDASDGMIDIGDDKFKLALNAIYTIRSVTIEFGELAFSLMEHPEHYEDEENIYFGYLRASRFRPLTARPTSIETFMRMLTPQKEDA